jgi:nicotinamidase-related amidase
MMDTHGVTRALNLSKAALVLLDIQEDFLAAEGPLADVGLEPLEQSARNTLLSNCQRLVTRARASGRPIVYVRTAFRADMADCFFPPVWRQRLLALPPVLVEDSPGVAIPRDIAPQPTDFVITKRGLSAFQATDLDRLLRSQGVDTCVYCGLAGIAGSLDDTTRLAGLLGYDSVVACDAIYPLGSTLIGRAEARETDELLGRLAEAPFDKRPDPIRPALIIVAMSNDEWHPRGSRYRYGISAFGPPLADDALKLYIDNNNRLIEAMAARGFPIVHSQTGVSLDGADDSHSRHNLRRYAAERAEKFPAGVGYMVEGTWGAEILEGVRLPEKYYRVWKKGNSAFGLTHLPRLLRNLGVNLCIITGDATTACISDTVREGTGLGLNLLVVSDATCPANVPYHDVLANRVPVRSTDEVLSMLQGLS